MHCTGEEVTNSRHEQWKLCSCLQHREEALE